MHPETEPSAAYDELLKKIGRNLILFQQAELIIKRLMKFGSYTVIIGESPAQQLDPFAKKTLGQITKEFLGNHFFETDPPLFPDPPLDTTAPSIQKTFAFVQPPEAIEQRRLGLAALVEERNHFAHHQFSNLNPESVESCRSAITDLDEQRLRILPEIKTLQRDLSLLERISTDQNEFFKTPEIKQQFFLPEIQHYPLIQQLITIAHQSTDPEGWTYLGAALKTITHPTRAEIEEFCALLGLKSLSALLTASRLFETRMLGATESSKGQTQFRLLQQTTAPIPQAHPIP